MAQNDPAQKGTDKAAAAEKKAADKAAAEATASTTPAAADPEATATVPVVVVDPQAQQRELAQIADEAREITETHETEGGRYLVGGRFVDANGEPIKEKKSKKDQD